MNPTDNPLDSSLDQLRDIHLPAPVSIWPPAPGWWMLIILGFVLLLVGFWIYRRFIRPNVRKQALQELVQLNQSLASELDGGNGTKQFYIDVSILIRRIAISVFGSRRVAGLAGESWLNFLDETSKTTFFTAGNGRLLITAPYNNSQNSSNGSNGNDLGSENAENERVDIEQFSNEIKNWVLKNT